MAFRMRLLFCLIVTANILAANAAVAGEPLSVGVLKFGTVNWQLDTVKAHRLDEAVGVSFTVLPL